LVSVKADLEPLPRPAVPGGFDFARQMYFDSIGAMGRFSELIIVDRNIQSGYTLRSVLHDLRTAIGLRVHAAVDPRFAGFAEALITGERQSIPAQTVQSLQNSGLFHIVSISGLHMTLVAGSVFWLVRAGLACVPFLALNWPIKKIAAAAAIAVGFFYMLLADSGAATERSFIMIAVLFFAVLVDRPAISLHNLALAAIIVLVWQPEEAVSAGFQMSFMAVMGLAAFYGWWSRPKAERDVRIRSWLSVWLGRQTRKGVATIAATLIAGLFSGLAAAHHFGRVAPFGAIANGFALPVTGLLVMAPALLGTLLIPVGLEYYPFKILEFGLSLIMKISDWIAAWPGSGVMLPTLPVASAVALSAALALLCLCKGTAKLFAIPVALSAMMFLSPGLGQNLYVDSKARNAAFIDDAGQVVPVFDRAGSFSFKTWARLHGDAATQRDANKRAGWICTVHWCEAMLLGKRIVLLREQNQTARECPRADIVLAQYPLRRHCKGSLVTLDRFDVWRNGAYALELKSDGISLEHARGAQANRPWAYDARPRRLGSWKKLETASKR
jgi:competence protein ComEC